LLRTALNRSGRHAIAPLELPILLGASAVRNDRLDRAHNRGLQGIRQAARVL